MLLSTCGMYKTQYENERELLLICTVLLSLYLRAHYGQLPGHKRREEVDNGLGPRAEKKSPTLVGLFSVSGLVAVLFWHAHLKGLGKPLLPLSSWKSSVRATCTTPATAPRTFITGTQIMLARRRPLRGPCVFG